MKAIFCISTGYIDIKHWYLEENILRNYMLE